MDDFAGALLMVKAGHPELAGWWGKLLGGGVKTLYTITPKQQGAGDPSPDNIRPISPGLTLTRDSGSKLEVYGGTLDTVTGTLTSTMALTTLAKNDTIQSFSNNAFAHSYDGLVMAQDGEILSNQYPAEMTLAWANMPDMTLWAFVYGSTSYVRVRNTNCANVNDFKASLARNILQIVYTMTTPITYQLTQTETKRAVAVLRH